MGSMNMYSELLKEPLLTTSYKQFWSLSEFWGEKDAENGPSEKLSRSDVKSASGRRVNFLDSNIVCCPVLPDSGRPETDDSGSSRTPENMMNHVGFAKLDQSTLQLLGWSSGALDNLTDEEDDGSDSYNNKDRKDIRLKLEENIYRMSKVEFRRLTEQVRDVSMNLRNKFRTSAYQKLYQQQQQQQQLPQPVENGTQLYRSQLAASLKAFKPKVWPPLNNQELETHFLRCKPINCSSNESSGKQTNTCTRITRPRSVPATSYRPASSLRRSATPTDVKPGNYDTLNPRVLGNLIGDSRPKSSYGDRIPSPDDSDEKQKAKDDDVSTSGIDSIRTDDDSSSSTSSVDEDSDYEPSIDRNRSAPSLNLRPEKLDSLSIPDSSKGWRKFDFEADVIDIPPYEFPVALPDPFNDLDLRQITRLKWNWRDQTKARPEESVVEDMLDRMLDLERLQMETEDWENKRTSQMAMKRCQKRIASAKPNRDKRCCNRCLQPACTGDCPEKNVQSEICDFCKQIFCVGTCKETKYDQKMRQLRVDDDRISASKTFYPKACRSCQSKHNAKYINANNLVLGRPKSSNATYSRGQASAKPRDLRTGCETPINDDLVKEFEKLGIDAQIPSRPSTAKPPSRPRSRNSVIPGKTYFSNRRDSISDNKNTSLQRKKTKSVRLKRPKTAI